MAKKTTATKNIMERVTSFEEACVEEGKDPVVEMAYFDGLPDSIRDYHRGIHRNDLIIKALNEDAVFDWNANTPKWFNYYWMDKAGFRDDGSRYGYAITYSGAGSGPFASRELAQYFAKQFLHEAKVVFIR